MCVRRESFRGWGKSENREQQGYRFVQPTNPIHVVCLLEKQTLLTMDNAGTSRQIAGVL